MENVSRGGRPIHGFGISFGLADEPPSSCPAALPSGSSAANLLRGDWSALPAVVGYTAARAALSAVGLALVGERQHIVRNAVGSALAIEAFVLAWAAWKLHRERA